MNQQTAMDKTLDQVWRYVSDHRFEPGDWEKVVAFANSMGWRNMFRNRKEAEYTSTYAEFEWWLENGIAPGDFVRYGDMLAVVESWERGGAAVFAAYTFQGRLIQKRMEVLNPERIIKAGEEDRRRLLGLLDENKIFFNVRMRAICEMYTPEKYAYVSFDTGSRETSGIGMYSGSDDSGYRFVAFLGEGGLKMDYQSGPGYAVFKKLLRKDVQKLHAAASAEGYIFNERTRTFVKAGRVGHNNVYWYLNDRFNIVKDVDNGSEKHKDRFDAGNYFLDQTEAALFAQMLIEMARTKSYLG